MSLPLSSFPALFLAGLLPVLAVALGPGQAGAGPHDAHAVTEHALSGASGVRYAAGPDTQRFFVADPAQPSGAPDLLLARIECVAFHRADIAQRWAKLPRRWSMLKDLLARKAEALDAFEAAFIRPFVDPETQDVLIATYWPEGVAPTYDGVHRSRGYEGVTEVPIPDATTRARQEACIAFANAHRLAQFTARTTLSE